MKNHVLLATLIATLFLTQKNSSANTNNSFVKHKYNKLYNSRLINQPIKKNNNYLTSSPSVLLQFTDSIYEWNWDISTSTYLLVGKFTNIINDSNGNVLSAIHQKFINGLWQNDEKNTSVYNSSNLETHSLFKTWDGTGWVNSQQNIYSYNSNNDVTSALAQEWINFAWQNTYTANYVYDTNNNITKLVEENYSGGVLANKSQINYTYDSNNNNLAELYKVWNNGVWENVQNNTYIFDSNNNNISEIDSTWNGSAWEILDTVENTFDLNHNKLTRILKDNLGVNLTKSTNTYDINNNKLTQLFQEWNSAWINKFKTLATYNINNDQINFIEQYWVSNKWVKSSESSFIYDANNFIQETKYITLDLISGAIIRGDSEIYYYHTGNTASLLSNNAVNTVRIYPNPTQNNLIVTVPLGTQSITITAITGQELITTYVSTSTPTHTIDVSNIPNGIYLLNITQEGTTIKTVKFIKNTM